MEFPIEASPASAGPSQHDEIDLEQLSFTAPERRPSSERASVRVEGPSTWWDRRTRGDLSVELRFAGWPVPLQRVSPEVLEAQLPRVGGGRHAVQLALREAWGAPVSLTREVLVEDTMIIDRVAGRTDGALPWWHLGPELEHRHFERSSPAHRVLVRTHSDPLFGVWLALLALLSALGWSWASARRRPTHVAAIRVAAASYRERAGEAWRLEPIAAIGDLTSTLRCVRLGPLRLVLATRPVLVSRPGGREEVRSVFLVESDTTVCLGDGSFVALVDGDSVLRGERAPSFSLPRVDFELETTTVPDGAVALLRRVALASGTVALISGTCIATSGWISGLRHATPFVVTSLLMAGALVAGVRWTGVAARYW